MVESLRVNEEKLAGEAVRSASVGAAGTEAARAEWRALFAAALEAASKARPSNPRETRGRANHLERNAMRRILVLTLCLLLPAGAAVWRTGCDGGNGKRRGAQGRQARGRAVCRCEASGLTGQGRGGQHPEKSGGWYQIKGKGAQGWVRMLSVRRGQAGKSSAAKDVAAISTGRAGTGQIVSTTGVRGLSEEELKAAKYDAAQLKQAEAFAVTKASAGIFAQKAQLAARPFNYLPAN